MGQKEDPGTSRMNPPDETLNQSLLWEGLIGLGLFQDRVLSLLTRYIEEIEFFNKAFSLVKVQSRRELIIKHIFDSLAPVGILQKEIFGAGLCGLPGKKIADVGSGAGLPGIPLAICMPGAEFTLIERMGRRAGFLRNTIAVLGLYNVKAEEVEMESFPVSEGFDIIVFRAFKPLETVILKRLLRLLKPGGIIAAYKGRFQAVKEEMGEVMTGMLEQFPWKLVSLEIPFLEEERHLVLIRNDA